MITNDVVLFFSFVLVVMRIIIYPPKPYDVFTRILHCRVFKRLVLLIVATVPGVGELHLFE